ncbi:MAG: class I SAM-dependent methyltransferase [Vicinamibacterales bacterium]
MNRLHRRLCASGPWRRHVREGLLPWALEGIDLGANVLEIGPGPGVTTDLLRRRVVHLTCVEIDPGLAEALGRRMAGAPVTVRCEDATALSAPDASFDGAACFTMLHHVPSPDLQDRLLGEVARVLRPGAWFAGADSLPGVAMRVLHLFDTMVLVDPASFPSRLERAGFTDIRVEAGRHAFRFAGRREALPGGNG